MHAVILNCSLKGSPQTSNTEALAGVAAEALHTHGVATTMLRIADLRIPPGVESDLGPEDDWPAVRQRIIDSEILIVASPTWLGRPSSLAQRVLERMDAMISELHHDRPVAYGKVAGVVVTGNEDGAHHVISEISGALIDIGFTIPPQAWTYWNRGPGPGKDYLSDPTRHEWSHKTGRQCASNLAVVARALQSAHLIYED